MAKGYSVTTLMLVIVLLVGLAGTLALERLAPHLGLISLPNERSSHKMPTPRGGGLAIALAVSGMALWLGSNGALGFWLVAVAIALIGMLGFADDIWDLSPIFRLPAQLVILLVLTLYFPSLPSLTLPWEMKIAGVALTALMVLTGIWWVNLFNFMDGIDGLAASQTIIILSGSLVVWSSIDRAAPGDPVFWFALGTVTATLGFLCRNWPPAHIFMGDAGSNALALAIFAVALFTVAQQKLHYETWLVLTSVFTADATTTLVRRTMRGERPWQPHRRHAYQHLARRWGHRRTTMLYATISLVWSIPMAVLLEHLPNASWTFVSVAYAPLIIAAWRAGAGSRSE